MRTGGFSWDADELSDPSSDDVVSTAISGLSLNPAVADFGLIDRLPPVFFSIAPIGAFIADSVPQYRAGVVSRAAADEKEIARPAVAPSGEFQPTPDADVIARTIDFSQPRGFKVDIVPPLDTGPFDEAVFTQYDPRALLESLIREE